MKTPVLEFEVLRSGRAIFDRFSKDGIVPVSCISQCKDQSGLVVWSSESSDVAESQWMSPGCEQDLAFLLVYTDVGAHLGVMLAASMPLLVKAGLTSSSVFCHCCQCSYQNAGTELIGCAYPKRVLSSPVVSQCLSGYTPYLGYFLVLQQILALDGERKRSCIRHIGILAHCHWSLGDRTPAFPEGNHYAAATISSQGTG